MLFCWSEIFRISFQKADRKLFFFFFPSGFAAELKIKPMVVSAPAVRPCAHTAVSDTGSPGRPETKATA